MTLVTEGEKPPFTVLIAGPTASGKTALSLKIAEALDAVVVNADSMQIYRDLSILSARPNADEMAQAKHVLFGHVGCDEPYNVMRWVEEFSREYVLAQEQQRPVVVVGGTGLYFKAACEGFSLMPDIDSRIRQYWRDFSQDCTEGALYEALQQRDEVMAARLHAGDTQRLVRALEVIDSTGQSLSYWQQTKSKPILNVEECQRVILAPERSVLHERIHQRFDSMLALGAVDEAVALWSRPIARHLPIMKAIGVAQLAQAHARELSFEEAITKAKTETRRYAKRQMTFFKGQLSGWPMLDPLDKVAADGFVKQILALYQVGNPSGSL